MLIPVQSSVDDLRIIYLARLIEDLNFNLTKNFETV